jgi:hypothetical protein
MPDYRRNRIPGVTYFFTVTLLDRRRVGASRHPAFTRHGARRAIFAHGALE